MMRIEAVGNARYAVLKAYIHKAIEMEKPVWNQL
jgi:hypothetical protein